MDDKDVIYDLPPKNKDLTRIALIGDSMTMGHYDMFPKSIGWP